MDHCARKRLWPAVLGLAALIALTGCSSAVPTETPGVDRMGEYVLRYRGPELEAAVGYRFAALSLGDDWLILDIAVSGADSGTTEIRRDRIFLRTPAGETVPLATQDEFAREYSRLRATLQREAITADPLDYFKARTPCALQLFTAPGEGLAFDSTTVNDRRVCSGQLFFLVPGGIQAGHWVLGIDLEESKIRIPFTL
ncbi:MAG: hypothetical protein ACM3O7_08665 [Acidobacteriota bacterium]